jgi:sec-independent protein translocase protein TatA
VFPLFIPGISNQKTRNFVGLTIKYIVMLQSVNTIMMISMPGGTEWVLIILAVLILFGGRKIPEFMRGLGRGIREFNDAKTNVKKELEDGMNEKDSTVREKSSTPVQH